MSTSYHPIAMFGINFQKSQDYYQFLAQNTQLAQLCNVSNLDDLDDHISYAVEEHLSPLKHNRYLSLNNNCTTDCGKNTIHYNLSIFL